MMIYVVIILIFTLIGLIFSIRARAKGYKNGISTAGLILSIIALAITAVILIVYFVVGAIVV